jgi:hypothetical protein
MILDSTKAGILANSYSSVEEAEDYFENTYGKSYWLDLEDREKEALLIMATRMIDRLRVIYPSMTETQKLKFPVNTSGRTDKEGRLLGDGYDRVKEATMLQADYIYQYSDELDQAKENRIQQTTDKQIGTASVKQTMNGFNPMATISPEAIAVLNPYIDLTVKAQR